jgi:hypothetical protein
VGAVPCRAVQCSTGQVELSRITARTPHSHPLDSMEPRALRHNGNWFRYVTYSPVCFSRTTSLSCAARYSSTGKCSRCLLNVRSLIVHICRYSFLALFLKKYIPIARMGIKKVSILLLVLLRLFQHRLIGHISS